MSQRGLSRPIPVHVPTSSVTPGTPVDVSMFVSFTLWFNANGATGGTWWCEGNPDHSVPGTIWHSAGSALWSFTSDTIQNFGPGIIYPSYFSESILWAARFRSFRVWCQYGTLGSPIAYITGKYL